MQSTTAAVELRHGAWEDLLPAELLGRIASMCPNPADRARFRSVCRSWLLAVRHHCPQTTTLLQPPPLVVLSDGSFLMLSDGGDDRHLLPSAILPYLGQPDVPYFCQPPNGGPHRLVSLPEGTTCVGSTYGWLALCRTAGRRGGGDTFMLHSPFSNTTVPLPGVDAICAKATALGEWFRVFKVLLMMRSSAAAAADVVVVISQSRSYPFVLSRLLPVPGKGKDDVWTPEPHAPPFMHIIDVAFAGDDKLYGITRAEDLFCFHLSLVHGVPVVTRCERVIRHPLDCYYGGHYGYEYYTPWSDDDDDDDSAEEEDEEEEDQELDDDDDDDDEEEEEVDDDDDEEQEQEQEDIYDGDYDDERKLQVPSNVDVWHDDIDGSKENDEHTIVIRYLVESCGKKLIMVRRELQSPYLLPTYTRKVEVFEADTEAGAWLPLPSGMGLGLGLADDGGGQALFLGQRFSKCVSMLGYSDDSKEVDQDSIYFMDTGEAFDMRSATVSPRRWCLHKSDPTWVFPPGLVV